ncbi:MAG: rhodanese-like domain-containing protein [Methylococcaceae bacterium]|jgi:rhodanese-related sulfurtransferase
MALTAMDLVAQARQQIKEIDIAQSLAKLDGTLILDVREPAEFSSGHLPNAINIPRGVLEFKISDHPNFKNKHNDEIIVYCQSGNRSALATVALNQMGYSNALSMIGGFQAWLQAGHQTQA